MRATIALTALLMSSAAGLAGPIGPQPSAALPGARQVQHARADVQALADRMLGVEPERTAPQKKKPTPPGVAATSALTPAQTQPAAQKGDIDKLFALTEDKYRKGDVEGAIATLDRIQAADGRNPKVYFYRGEIRLRKGELEAAAADLDRAIGLDPKLVGAYVMRCVALLDLGKLEQATADAEHLVRVAANDARSFNLRGLARHQKGQHDGAIEDFNRAVAIDPALGFVYENRALTHQAMQNRAAAFADLTRALSVTPRSVRAFTIRGQVYISQSSVDQAIAEYKQALAIDAGYKPALLGFQAALVAKSMSQFDKLNSPAS